MIYLQIHFNVITSQMILQSHNQLKKDINVKISKVVHCYLCTVLLKLIFDLQNPCSHLPMEGNLKELNSMNLFIKKISSYIYF